MYSPIIKQNILGKLRSVEQELCLLKEQIMSSDKGNASNLLLTKKIEELQLQLTSAVLNLSASEKIGSFALNHLHEGIIWVDSNEQIINMNAAAEIYTGWDVSEAAGKHPDEVVPLCVPNSDDPVVISFAEVFNSRNYENNDKYYELKSKKDVRYKVTRSIFPLHEKNNYFKGYLIVIQDHTEKYFLDKYLKASRHKLKLKLDYFLTSDNTSKDYKLTDIVYLNQLQKLQDAFSLANNVASCIIDQHSGFITNPNRFAEFLIYYSKKTACSNPCYASKNSDIGFSEFIIESNIQQCPDCHILSFAAPIIVGGKQLATWHVGQIALNSVNFVKINEYLKEFAKDKSEYIDLHFLIFNNSIDDFHKKAELLLIIAKELSTLSQKNLTLANEIELRKQKEQNVFEREQYLHAILSANPGIIIIANENGILQNIFSAKPDLLLGKTTESFIGKQLDSFFPEDVVSKAKKHIIECLQTNNHQYFEFPLQTTDRFYWFSANISRIVYNEATCAMIVATDVTPLKIANEALKKSKEEKKAILNNIPYLAWLKDTEGNYLDVNDNFLTLFGLRQEDVIGQADKGLILKEPTIQPFLDNNTLNEEINSSYYETSFETQQGRRWYETYKSPVFDSSGNIIGSTGISRDITERKADEENLAIFKRFADNSSQGMCFTDLEGQIIYLNKALSSLLGYDSAEELIGKHYNEFLNTATNNFFDEVVFPILQRDGQWIGELKDIRNENHALIQNIFTIRDNNDKPLYYGDIITDISHLKAAENALKIAKEKAEASDKLKSAFLANMSHEIRTPMNGIIGFTNLLNDREIDKTTREEYVGIINSNSNTLLKLIDDILDIAKIEAGELSIDNKPFSINSLMLDIQKLFESDIHKRNDAVKLRYVPPKKNTEIIAVSDCNRLYQILSNLISNAFKFTIKGKIEFGFELTENRINFFVKDTGIGIQKDHLPLIFERFRQIEDHRLLDHKGTGLGLTISYNIVKLLGGELTVNSKYNKGTEFNFYIPYKTTIMTQTFSNNYHSESFNRIHFDWNKKTILIAEDEEMNFMYLKEILKKSNVNIIHARDGEEAITFFKESEGDIDLIIMDIKMPKVDGIEATQTIKTLNPAVPIIAHTAYAMEDDKQRCLNAGCDDYISKPINRDLFMQILNNYLSEN